jgi:hypothetical protein
MKTKFSQIIAGLIIGTILSFAAIALTGCKTGPNGQRTLDLPNISALTNYTTVATIAAKDGTMLALKAKPEWRPGFVQARDSLLVLAKSNQVDFSSLLKIVSKLDVKQLKGDTAQMIISDVDIILQDTVNGKLAAFDKNQSADVAKLADAIARGITIGLGE